MSDYISNEYLDLLNVPTLWNFGFTGKGVKVAIMESAITTLPGKLNIQGWFNTETNVYTETAPNFDSLSDHGFSTASIISGYATGVAPDCKLYNVIVKTDMTNISNSLNSLKKGLKWCIANSIDIINISLEIPFADAELISLTKLAAEKNIIIVSSLGNSSSETCTSFISSGSVLSIGSVNKDKSLSSFSNYGDCIDFVSFGDAVPAYNSKGEKISFVGTSASTPLVSGLVALIKQQNKDLSFKELKYMLMDNAETLNANLNNNSISFKFPKACLIPCNHKHDLDIVEIEKNIPIQDLKIITDSTINIKDTITPIIQISPKSLDNLDVLVTSSNEKLTQINYFSNSITAIDSGYATINFSIPQRNFNKSIVFHILSQLEQQLRYSLNLYNITNLQNKNLSGQNIKVAIIDSGVNIVGNIDSVTYGPNYITYQPTTAVTDTFGQGTITASIVKAIAPNCKLYSIKNQSNAGYSYVGEDLQNKALKWCLDNKMDVVIARNLQLGLYDSKNKLFKQLNDAGILTIVSQLSGDSLKFESSDRSNFLCVGPLNSNKSSNFGYLDVTCYNESFPAYTKDGIFQLISNDTFQYIFGIIGGICTLLKQQNSSLNASSLKSLLPTLCTNMGEFKYFGYGILKAYLL